MIQSELTYVLTENFQWKEAQFQFIPCSGLLGSNLNNVKKITKSKYKSEFDAINDVPEWYEGPTFFSQLYFLMELNMNKIETTLEEPFIGLIPVSYTHLDVYKRQSFRLNEDDLAIFDLFGNGKTVKHQPKTYRTKK